jgi:hypothetical protein
MTQVLFICPFSNKTIAKFVDSTKKDVARSDKIRLVNGEIYTLNEHIYGKDKKSFKCTCGHENHRQGTYKPIIKEVENAKKTTST